METWGTSLFESNDMKYLFLNRLKDITTLIESAGIIHADLRLYNIFYYISSISSCACSSSNFPNQNIVVDIKLVDRDDCCFIGSPLENRGEYDERFPNLNVASSKVHTFFISAISKSIFGIITE